MIQTTLAQSYEVKTRIVHELADMSRTEEDMVILCRKEDVEVLAEPTSCKWELVDSYYYNTACEHGYEFTDGEPFAYDFKFCPYCGLEIVEEKEPVED